MVTGIRPYPCTPRILGSNAPLLRASITLSYVIGVLAITLVWTLHFLQKTGRRHWWTGFVFTLTYIGFFGWQIYWALATLKGKKWGTR